MAKSNKDNIKKLQLEILRAQQGIFHSRKRVIIVFEGMDASGKGGAIRRVTENLDPRGFHVYPIAKPSDEEQGKHYLYRFWTKIPSPGMISVFDRSWYGRVLVERVEKLIPNDAWNRAYMEINQFEKLLIDDGVKIIKICLKISKKEQLKRFEERLKDPYKQWKITSEDIRNRSKWTQYMKAHEDMFMKTSTEICPWHIIETDDKDEAREAVLEVIASECRSFKVWMEKNASHFEAKKLQKELSKLS